MISMNKYNKVMKKIKVTPEMHERIMQAVQETDFETKPKKVYFWQEYKKYIGVAACALLCVVGTLVLPDLFQSQQEPLQQAVSDIKECNSKDELSTIMGFEVKEVKGIPFNVQQVSYVSFWRKIAQVQYMGENNTLTFRMSQDNQEVSGDYNHYNDIKECLINDMTVVLKGNHNLYNLAIWSDGEFSYALQSEATLTEGIFIQIIQSIE